MATTKHIRRERGDTYRIRFEFTDPETGDALDLTGATLVLTVNEEQYPADATNEVFSVAGVIFGDAENGVCDFSPTTEDAANVGSYYYDVQLTGADASIRTLCRGQYRVFQDITKN